MRAYTLRPATAADFAFLARLHETTMREYVAATWGWDAGFQRRRFGELFDPTHEQIVVVGDKEVGVVSVEQHADHVFLNHIEIDPAWQRQGIGGAIVAAVVGEAAASGLPVALRVLKVNPARALYERLGFAVTGETATHWLMRTPPG